jgi:hypothetical protein
MRKRKENWDLKMKERGAEETNRREMKLYVPEEGWECHCLSSVPSFLQDIPFFLEDTYFQLSIAVLLTYHVITTAVI